MFIIWLCWLFQFWKDDQELEVCTATYGLGIDQSQHVKSVSHIIKELNIQQLMTQWNIHYRNYCFYKQATLLMPIFASSSLLRIQTTVQRFRWIYETKCGSAVYHNCISWVSWNKAKFALENWTTKIIYYMFDL